MYQILDHVAKFWIMSGGCDEGAKVLAVKLPAYNYKLFVDSILNVSAVLV